MLRGKEQNISYLSDIGIRAGNVQCEEQGLEFKYFKIFNCCSAQKFICSHGVRHLLSEEP